MTRAAWILLLAAGLIAGDGDASSDDPTSPVSAGTVVREGNVSAGRSTATTPDALSSRDLSEKQMATVVAVAADVSPEWGAMLQSRMSTDPEGVKRAILANGRRLLALAVLRDQNPDLYRMKVDELRMEGEMKALAKRYRLAMAEGRATDAESWRRKLEAKVREQVDLDLKTRAEELAALDRHVSELREQLVRDTTLRQDRIRETLERMTGRGRSGSTSTPPPERTADAGEGRTDPAPERPGDRDRR